MRPGIHVGDGGEEVAPTLTHVADGAHPASDQVSLRDLHGQAQVGDPNVA